MSGDDRPGWASVWFPGLAQLQIEGLGPETFGVAHGGFDFACRFSPARRSDTLVVSIRSAAAADDVRPVFYKEGWFRESGAHLLRVCDPTLLMDPDLLTGAMLGPEDNDPTLRLAELAGRLADILGVSRQRIVYTGVCGSGLAALMTAIRTNGRAVAVNPHLDIRRSSRAVGAPLVLRRFRPDMTIREFELSFPLRNNVASALQDAVANGLEPRLLIAQNTADIWTYRAHYSLFCRQHPAPIGGGLSADGRVMTLPYNHPSGHDIEPEEIRAPLRDLVRRFLLSDDIAPEAPALRGAPLVGSIDLPAVVTPPDDTLAAVCSVYADILDVADVPVDQDIFELGGDSVQMVQITIELELRFNVELALDVFEEWSDAASVANWIDGQLLSRRNIKIPAEAS